MYRCRAWFPVWGKLGFEALLGDLEETAVLPLRVVHPDVVRVLIDFCSGRHTGARVKTLTREGRAVGSSLRHAPHPTPISHKP